MSNISTYAGYMADLEQRKDKLESYKQKVGKQRLKFVKGLTKIGENDFYKINGKEVTTEELLKVTKNMSSVELIDSTKILDVNYITHIVGRDKEGNVVSIVAEGYEEEI